MKLPAAGRFALALQRIFRKFRVSHNPTSCNRIVAEAGARVIKYFRTRGDQRSIAREPHCAPNVMRSLLRVVRCHVPLGLGAVVLPLVHFAAVESNNLLSGCFVVRSGKYVSGTTAMLALGMGSSQPRRPA
jgi:hypothetical protein